ncbi:murein L,D-transpeptidase catalytic domain family protein [Stenotrophomonas sp. S48]|uniref:murein L,D-transpeptidase catalytic domain family protein n=1 Tax=unclassified Stenotrophomonas TaxID=196198 RepID=UPI001901F755|nr:MULTISPECIES: murein L,D-transpeptidase catalytic domain family protein [unclassified Stenotrophomonas]MBK0026818.1 murein L,D-transpeptidase catalytic domain family protein [Stenotrophomonas sp. S48]MBK0048735.1 murein L,D-transpeptidase catalytic domain family protein [Stenotrophomonas sp. S49]
MNVSRTCWRAAGGLLAILAGATSAATPPAAATTSTEDLTALLARTAPNADRQVLKLAATALRCSLQRPELGVSGERLAVIDYSRPSTEQRLWVFDLARQRLLFEEWVAHGRNSGGNRTEHFSNRDGSFMSSIGAFTAKETYMGGNGYSLRLDGLEPGYNDLARDRAIVIHGAPYVNPTVARLQGRLGRSLGCPAVRLSVSRPLIDSLRGGALVFAYYPDPDWLKHSKLLDGSCGGAS